MTSANEIKLDNPTYISICEDALNKTIVEENGYANSGCEITAPSALHTAYFLTVKDPDSEHRDLFNNVEIKNAIIVVSSYEIVIWSTVDRIEYIAYVYPDCIIAEDGRFEYDAESVYDHYFTADSIDEVFNRLCENYDDMDIYSVSLPE